MMTTRFIRSCLLLAAISNVVSAMDVVQNAEHTAMDVVTFPEKIIRQIIDLVLRIAQIPFQALSFGQNTANAANAEGYLLVQLAGKVSADLANTTQSAIQDLQEIMQKPLTGRSIADAVHLLWTLSNTARNLLAIADHTGMQSDAYLQPMEYDLQQFINFLQTIQSVIDVIKKFGPVIGVHFFDS